MVAAVIMATVDDPCAVLRIKVNRNGNRMPILFNPIMLLKCAPRFVAARTAPNAPPAPIITRMLPALSMASCNRSLIVFFCQSFFVLNASSTPMLSAITGSPNKSILFQADDKATDSGFRNDLIAINAIGTITGRKAFSTPGCEDVSSGISCSSMLIS